MSSAVFAILKRACMAFREGDWEWGGIMLLHVLCVEKAEGTLFMFLKDRKKFLIGINSVKKFLIGIHSVKVIFV